MPKPRPLSVRQNFVLPLLSDMEDRIAVIGGGPAGSLIALLLAQKGYFVDVYEKRPSFIQSEPIPQVDSVFGVLNDAAKRSINLALSFRGQSALEKAGVLERVMSQTVPMPSRAIHSIDGHVVTQPYGTEDQAIYSVSRQYLNNVLIDELGRLSNVNIYFQTVVDSINRNGVLTVTLKDGTIRSYKPLMIVGADGAFSVVRNALLRYSRSNFQRRFIEHGYKELEIPASVTGDFALSHPRALHIWPREKFMLVALPNRDRSFTCTLFMPYEQFEPLDTNPGKVKEFFNEYFPDAVQLFPGLEEQFARNPTSSLVDVRVNPITFLDRIFLVGDAAHSTVPFYGQGMNAALEDCLVYIECLEAEGDVHAAVKKYGEIRQAAGEALCELSMDNYVEMRSHTASRLFRLRKKVESILHSIFPSFWIPQYTMVAFTRIPYNEVREKIAQQDRIVSYCVNTSLFLLAGATIFYYRQVGSKSSFVEGIKSFILKSFGRLTEQERTR